MSKSEVKPFKIRQSILYPGGSKPEGAPDFCTIEVIEYFSYQSLQKENEELKDKLKKADQDHYNIAWELEHKEYMLKVLTEALHNPGKKNKVE